MCTAFLLGAVAFGESISNPIYGALSIPTLILGVMLILSCDQIQRDFSPLDTSMEEEIVFTENNSRVRKRSDGGTEMHILQTDEVSAHGLEQGGEKCSAFLYEAVHSSSHHESEHIPSELHQSRETRTSSMERTNLLSNEKHPLFRWVERQLAFSARYQRFVITHINTYSFQTIKAVFICLCAGFYLKSIYFRLLHTKRLTFSFLFR
jgi:hypothetical protein